MQDWRDLARPGQNQVWRYGLGITLFLLVFGLLGSLSLGVFSLVWLIFQGVPPEQMGTSLLLFLQTPSVAGFIANNLPFVWGLGALFLIVQRLHRRPFRSLLGGDRQLHGKRLGAAFGLWFLLLSFSTAITALLAPGDFHLTFKPLTWLGLVLVAVPLTTLQVSCEELFFRGYLLQGLGLRLRSHLVLSVLTAVLFALVHLANPEVQRGAGWIVFYYFSFGLLAAWLTLKENRLELALGLHLATNLFGILIVSSSDSVLPAPALFQVNAVGNPAWSVVVFLLDAAIFYGILRGRPARKPSD